ncbi:MAG: hypothetical protein ACRYG8_24210, partial [Janthinobacterium lividum]
MTDPTAAGALNTVCLTAMSNGTALPGVISANVHSNNWFQADTFSLTAALHAVPSGGPVYWGSNDRINMLVEILFDAGGGPVSQIIGQVDHITLDLQGGLVTLEGRDLSARLIEAKTQETFPNQTASEVAQKLADRHMLKTDIDPTTTLVERFYAQDHTKTTGAQFSRTTTEWDLLADLARHEGFGLWVSGTTLHFKQPASSTAKPYAINWTPTVVSAGFGQLQENTVIELRLERALTLAKDIEVVVRSWQSKNGRGFEKKGRAIGGKSASASVSATQKGASTQRYVFVRPNLSEDAAQKLADQFLAEISLHERNVSFRAPGNLTLAPRTPVVISGTGSSWDDTFAIDAIDRHVS